MSSSDDVSKILLDAARAAYDPDGRFHAWMGRVGANGSGPAS